MILVKRSTVAFMILVALVAGAGLGAWGAGEVDSARPAARAPRVLSGQGTVVPAALPVPSGSFAQVSENVGPAVVNINTVTARGGGRTPIEEFFGDEFFRRFFGDAPERSGAGTGAWARASSSIPPAPCSPTRTSSSGRARSRP